MDTEIEFDNTRELVEKLLQKDERNRNDDKYLTYNVFQEIAKKHGKKIFIPFDLFKEFPAFETVKRVRAKIQNEENRFLPTDPNVLEKRNKRQKEVKDWLKK